MFGRNQVDNRGWMLGSKTHSNIEAHLEPRLWKVTPFVGVMKTDAMLNNNPKQLKVNQQNLLVHLGHSPQLGVFWCCGTHYLIMVSTTPKNAQFFKVKTLWLEPQVLWAQSFSKLPCICQSNILEWLPNIKNWLPEQNRTLSLILHMGV